MPHPPIVFGSSKDIIRPFWRVWYYDPERKEVVPLAHYKDKAKSDIAAFEFAHSAASLEDPKASDNILNEKDANPSPVPPKIEALFRGLAEDAIRISETPQPGKAVVTVRKTPDDTVYAVRFPENG